MRRTTLSAAALLGLTLLVPTGAGAAGETCQGRAATLIGQPEQVELVGTEQPDVIVTNGAYNVEALGGDDLICATGDAYVSVEAGAGNDVVDASTLPEGSDGVFAGLGAGDDTYVGSRGYDEVVTGDDTETDLDRDVVDTGGGTLADLVYSGQVRVANPDRITGDGLEVWWRGLPTATGFVDGGEDGRFRYYRPRGISRLEIDALAGTLSTDVGDTLQLGGFTSFEVDSDRGLRTVVFSGSDRGETVRASGSSPRTVFRVSLGAGDDRVSVLDVAKGSSLSGGGGADRILVGSWSRIELSLAEDWLARGAGKDVVTTEVTGFAHATVTSPDVTLAGTGTANDLVVNACRATVRGLGGRDEVTAPASSTSTGSMRCRAGRRAQLHGDAGNDVLVGSRGADLLVGGPGRDRVDGRTGRDTCEAERQRRCEVRLRTRTTGGHHR